MNDVPPAAQLTLQQLPLFPLQTALFPGGWMPLRIFEVRYLDMIRRCHAAGAPFGVVCLSEGSEVRRADPGSADGFASETLFDVGTIARIEQLESPQAGLLLIHCRGQQRFHITHRHRLPHGLWVADVTLDDPEPVVPVPEHLASTRDALQRVLAHLQEREPDGMNDLPLQQPYQWDDSGWIANRWAELLPLPPELKHRLMTLDSPLLRLELISDLLDQFGVDR
ncbi:MAG: LON peptidase substrate-binding domain-containing protein [Hydrogenophaga sp.]